MPQKLFAFIVVLCVAILPSSEAVSQSRQSNLIPRSFWGIYDLSGKQSIQLSQQGWAVGLAGDSKKPTFGFPNRASVSYVKIPARGIDGLSDEDREVLQDRIGMLRAAEESLKAGPGENPQVVANGTPNGSSVLDGAINDPGAEILVLISNAGNVIPGMRGSMGYTFIRNKQREVRCLQNAVMSNPENGQSFVYYDNFGVIKKR